MIDLGSTRRAGSTPDRRRGHQRSPEVTTGHQRPQSTGHSQIMGCCDPGNSRYEITPVFLATASAHGCRRRGGHRRSRATRGCHAGCHQSATLQGSEVPSEIIGLYIFKTTTDQMIIQPISSREETADRPLHSRNHNSKKETS